MLRSLRRRLGQTTTEYILVVSVISVAAMFGLAYFGDPNSPPQEGAKKLSDSFEEGLVNGPKKMHVE